MKAGLDGFSSTTCLVIERSSSCSIFEKPLTVDDIEAANEPLACWGIVGIISIDIHLFLCLVTERKLVATFRGQEIFEVENVKFITFERGKQIQPWVMQHI